MVRDGAERQEKAYVLRIQIFHTEETMKGEKKQIFEQKLYDAFQICIKKSKLGCWEASQRTTVSVEEKRGGPEPRWAAL